MGRTVLGLTLCLAAGCVLPRPIRHQAAPTTAALDAARHASAERGSATFGFSREGRPLRLLRLGTGSRKVLWIGGIHGSEREGHVATAELPAAFALEPGLAGQVTLLLVEDVNPDGSLADSRGNSHGIDLNRNFPAANFAASERTGDRPLQEPEAKALHDLLLAERPDLTIIAHSARRGRFINWDGPAEEAARTFAAVSGFPLVPSDELHATPGSLGSWWGREQQQPILTLEFKNGEDPDRAWSDVRAALLAVIRG